MRSHPLPPVITCPALPPIENGEVEVSANTVGGEAVYRCDVDLSLTLNGTSIRTCMENGEWSGAEPVCVGKGVACVSGNQKDGV